MIGTISRYTKDDAARIGDAIYEHDVRPQVEPLHNGEIIAIDLDTGDWEMDPDHVTVAHRLRARRPDAQIWFVRAGSRSVFRVGGAARL